MITQISLYLDRIVTTVRPEPQPSLTEGVVRLRSQPRTFSDDDVKRMLTKHNFFDVEWNKFGDFENDFVDNRNGTVTDRAIGLMWQQSGRGGFIKYEEARAYVDKLNRERFAGYSDWRLPTLEELVTLLEPSDDIHINPIFDKKQRWCWSADKGESEGAWSVNFDYGTVFRDVYSHYVRVVRSMQY